MDEKEKKECIKESYTTCPTCGGKAYATEKLKFFCKKCKEYCGSLIR